MTLINLEGEREANTQNSEKYGEKIIEYLQLRDYYLITDSNIDGIFQDKIFRRPKFDGERETVVEVKYSDLSLSDKNFLSELAKYFHLYMKQKKKNRFYFKIFAKNLLNISKWKRIFDETKLQDEEIEKFMEEVIASSDDNIKSKIEKFTYDDFSEFLSVAEVTQVGYEKLTQKIDEIKEKKLFNTEAEYLTESINLTYSPEKVKGNIIPIDKFPEKILSAKLQKSKNIWKDPRANQYIIYEGKIYSTKQFPEEIQKYLIKDSIVEERIADLKFKDEKEQLNFKKNLIKSFIISKSAIVGYWYDRYLKCLYFPLFEPSAKKPSFKVKGKSGHKTRIVAKVYIKDGKVNFVVHRALKIRVTNIRNIFYVIFNFFRIFTTDGKSIIRSEDAKRLHYKFPPTKAYNNIEESKLDFLITLLDLRTNDLSHPYFISTNKPVELTMPCTSEEGQIFQEAFDYEGSLYEFEEFEDVKF